MPASEVMVPDGRVVRCRGVCVSYRTAVGLSSALTDVGAGFDRGCLSVVAGPSGSGKSSLLRVLGGLIRPQSGSVHVGAVAVTSLRTSAVRRLRRRAMGIVLQNPADNLVEYLTAAEQVELAARLRGVDAGGTRSLLELVELADRAGAAVRELSGGEQQRVAFAAAAIGSPVLVLADEPTAQLDATGGALVVGAMRRLADEGATIVASSHDPDLIAAADDVVYLRDGRVDTER